MLAQNLQDIEGRALPGFKWASAPLGYIISQGILRYVFYLSGILLLIYMIFGGFQLMLAKGDPKAIQMGWAKVTNALIGFIIVIFAYFLVQIIGRVFGIGDFRSIFGG